MRNIKQLSRWRLGLTTNFKYQEAIKAFKEAIRIDPDDGLAHRGLGLAYV